MDSTLAKAVKAGSAARMASASARRLQMEQLRMAVQMHTAQNEHRRQQVSDALVRLRAGCAAFRKQVRARLRLMSAQTAARKPSR